MISPFHNYAKSFLFHRIILLTEDNYYYYEIGETEMILIGSIIISLAVKFHRIL